MTFVPGLASPAFLSLPIADLPLPTMFKSAPHWCAIPRSRWNASLRCMRVMPPQL